MLFETLANVFNDPHGRMLMAIASPFVAGLALYGLGNLIRIAYRIEQATKRG